MRNICLLVSGVKDCARERERTAWMFGDGWHRVHVRFGNVLDNDWDIVVPSTYRLVIGSGNETTIFIDESNSVNRSKMLVISLDNLVRSQIVLLISSTLHKGNY